MVCQVINGQFHHINSPLYVADTSKSCSYMLFLNDKAKINSVCLLSIIKQTHDEAININDPFWAIYTLWDDKKLYITCFQFSITIKLHITYDIIYLPDRCEANAMSFVLLCNNKLHVKSSIETPQYELGFNYSIINN